MRFAGWLRRYATPADPATAASNTVALVVAGNGPFYPVYASALIRLGPQRRLADHVGEPDLCDGAGSVASVVLRRACALPLIGIANTVWCSVLLGSASGVGLFLLPCVLLPAVLFGSEERCVMLSLIGLALGALVWLTEFPLVGLMDLTAAQAAALGRLDTISVATLIGFIALQLTTVLNLSTWD